MKTVRTPDLLTKAGWAWHATIYSKSVIYLPECSTTVGCEKLDPLFFLNNSLNIQRRTLKPPAMCFY